MERAPKFLMRGWRSSWRIIGPSWLLHGAAYGFNAKKDLLAQLLALNQQVAAKIERGEPVTAPGVPKNYPDAKQLVTEDCIKPSAEGA